MDRVRSIGDDGDDFLVSRDDCSRNTLAPGASCTLAVRFGPIGVGKRNSVLTVDSDATGSPLQVPLVGTGLKPATSATKGAHRQDREAPVHHAHAQGEASRGRQAPLGERAPDALRAQGLGPSRSSQVGQAKSVKPKSVKR
ncbi:MAG: hypothetical protein QOK00_582 [Thermoleophilaceae bacterium]|nr:hypothetical protein [Thermoleophilaceae bacterium]